MRETPAKLEVLVAPQFAEMTLVALWSANPKFLRVENASEIVFGYPVENEVRYQVIGWHFEHQTLHLRKMD